MKPILIPGDFDLLRLKTSDGKPIFSSDNLALYVQNSSPTIPRTLGLGTLSEASKCTVTYGPKGYDELEMEYPESGSLHSAIKLRDIIVANVGKRGNQPYRIYRITKPIDGKFTIYARHLAYDLSGIVVKPFSAENIGAALSGLKSNAMTNCPFTFTTSRTTAVPFNVKVPSSIWSLMGSNEGSLLDVYGGEYLFDEYSITFENQLGEDAGIEVTYGINMIDFEQDSNCESCYTGVVGYWQEDDKVVYSPVISATGNYSYVKILTVDMTEHWDTEPTQAELKTVIDAYILNNKIGVPKVSWKINFIPLGMTEEYRHIAAIEYVSLGDTVTVKFEKLGIKTKARVVEIEWDVLLDRYSSVSLGDVKNTAAGTIANQTTILNNIPTKEKTQSMVKQISTILTKTILGADGGAVRMLDTNGDGTPDTLYIADNPDPNLAVKVWRFNYEGWAASEHGYNGPFKMGATLNDGLLADFVTAANLTAGTIHSADGNTFYLNLDTGEMRIGGYAKSSDISDMATKTELATAGQTIINGGNITTGTMAADRIYGGTLSLGGNNNIHGKLVLLNAAGQPIAESDWMGISFYSGLSQADKHIIQRIGRNGFNINFSPNGDGASAGSAVAISGSYSGATAYGSISVGTVTSGATSPKIILNGETGRIDCKSLYINGQRVTP